jgi:MFS family permease
MHRTDGPGADLASQEALPTLDDGEVAGMVKLEGRQWGLVALVALTPFFFAFLLAASAPGLVEPVLGTVLGGASWLLASVLGLLAGALFAGGLSVLTAATPRPSPARRVLNLVAAALAPVGLCLVPALCLLLAGPMLALQLEQGEAPPELPRASTTLQLVEGLRSQLPRMLREWSGQRPD